MSAVKPCITYSSKLYISKIQKIKLENVIAGSLRKRGTLVFSSSNRMEGLLHVIDLFTKNASRIQLTNPQKWLIFENVLDKVAADKWTLQITGLTVHQKTVARFSQELDTFVQRYTGSRHPRDILLKFIESSECEKPSSVDPEIHASHMEVLCSYASRLQGTEPDLNDLNTKKKLFESFMPVW
eukprot:CAMPEP_0194155092 /NCGR_PEP_ID=MMETSP0152-20130528/63145_1 /TAXON_ID=1049557 /ORGANISM="Thalassiothrix antarctica, Strain L6-D1" /LENGTH=182 /DNA_ID=CAMNT_0038861671 /DNA_START=86 /DNA_END=631 /DNA_ORIENTATION=+